MFHVLFLSEGPWGVTVSQHIFDHAPSDWKVGAIYRGQPLRGPVPDLLVVLAESPRGFAALPELVAATRPAALLAPVEDPDWLPRRERKILTAALEASSFPCAFPSPFCALAGHQCPAIATFARRFGRPLLQVRTSAGSVREVSVLTDTPCGFASRNVPALCGVPVERAEDCAWDLQAQCPRTSLPSIPSDSPPSPSLHLDTPPSPSIPSLPLPSLPPPISPWPCVWRWSPSIPSWRPIAPSF